MPLEAIPSWTMSTPSGLTCGTIQTSVLFSSEVVCGSRCQPSINLVMKRQAMSLVAISRAWICAITKKRALWTSGVS